MSAGLPPGRLGRLADHPAALPALLVLALVLRLWALGGTGYPSDPGEVTRWALGVRQFGLADFYRHVEGGYYPAVLYLLGPLAALLSGDALSLAVKGLAIPFDLAIGVALHALVRRRASERHALLGAALYLLNPASIVGGAYWGQLDAIGALGMLLALMALGARRYGLAGALTVASGLVKATFGIVGLVLVGATAVELLRRRARRPAALALAGVAAAYAVLAWPIRLGPLDYLGLVREGGVRFPFTSLYALNPWFIFVGFFKPDEPYLVLGGALLAAGVALALVPLWRSRDLATLLAVGGFVTLAFYFLPTRVHERYLFPAIVLLAPFAAVRPGIRLPYVAFSAAFTTGLGYALWSGAESRFALPPLVERSLFTLPGMGLVAVVLMASAGLMIRSLCRGDATLAPAGTAARDPALGGLPRALADGYGAVARSPLVAAVAARLRERGAPTLGAWLLLVALSCFVAVGTAAELTPVLGLNDAVYHLRLVTRADEAIARGGNPFDFWVPELEQGFPVFVYYQHVAHLAVALLARVTLGVVDLRTLFDLTRWLLMAALPFTAYGSLRWAGFPRGVAAFAGAASVLVSSTFGFGLELDNYLWRGWGLYTQLWGAHLAFVAFGALYRLQEREGGVVPAFLALTALALTHLVYGYMAALTAVVLTLAGLSRATARRRLIRLALVGGLTAAATLYMLVPFASGQAYLLVSTYLPRYRFDGFGAAEVFGALFRGDLLDAHRLPVLTALAGAGAIAALVRRERAMILTLLLFVVWLVLFAGKPVTALLPLQGGLPVHRFIGSAQMFAVVLAGYGVTWLVAGLRGLVGARLPRLAPAVAPALVVVLLVPMLLERAAYFDQNAAWVATTDAAVRRDADAALVMNRLARLPPGRVTAGIRETWGDRLDFGIPFRSARFFDLITAGGYDTVRPPAYSFSLASDLLFDFDPSRPAIYDLWNARYVIAPPAQPLPPDLRPLLRTARYVLYEAPTSGYAEYVSLAGRLGLSNQPELLQANLGWVRGDGPERRAYLRYDFPAPSGSRGGTEPGCRAPQYLGELVEAQRLTFDVSCPDRATLVVKETYHPYLRVTVDGSAVATFMVSPGFLAVTLPPGRHRVVAEYGGAPYRTPLILVGVAVAALAVVFRRRLDRLAGGGAAS